MATKIIQIVESPIIAVEMDINNIIKIHCRIQNVDEIKIDNKRETIKEGDMQCNNPIMPYVICKLLQMMTQHQRKNMFPVLN